MDGSEGFFHDESTCFSPVINSCSNARNKISVITDVSVLGFYEYIRISVNIGGYFDKNIDKAKINKNTLKFMEIFY